MSAFGRALPPARYGLRAIQGTSGWAKRGHLAVATKAALRWKSHGAAEGVSRVRDPPCKAFFCDTKKCSFPLAFQQLVCRMNETGKGPFSMTSAVTYDEVVTAAGRIAGVAVRTPLLRSDALDAATGARIFLKPENLQRTGSFKFRGAYNRLSAIPPDQRGGGRRRLLLRQPCPGRRAGGKAARHAGGHRHAQRRAADQGGAHPRPWRRGGVL